MSRVAERLSAARRHHFVGRAAERALFRSALTAAELPFLVLYVHGPGGIGKTALLREFATLAQEAGADVYHLDARNVEPVPESFLHALRLALHLDVSEALAGAWSARPSRHVLLLDTVELLAPLDGWLREVFLPELPENVLVVLAGRNPPTTEWRADPGWQALMHILPLRNLSPDESRSYLRQRGVPAEQYDGVLRFTHGHPLALSLMAEMFAQRGSVAFQPEAAPDIIKVLVEQFVQKVPGPAHRAALEACAQVRVLSEPLLASMLNLPDSHELFEWLRGLSFVEAGPLGLFPHDLARESLVADLRWRHPDWYRELHRRARIFYVDHLGASSQEEQQRLLFDLVFLHRDNPAVRPFFEWTESGAILPDTLRPTDRPALLEMTARHEGPASAELASNWLAQQPEGCLVFRDAQQQPIGFMQMVALERATEEQRQRDPATRAAWAYLAQHAPLRSGERATLFRFWMAEETYQAVSPVQSLIFIQAVQHYLTTSGLAYTFFPCADADFWTPVLSYADLIRRPEADFEVGGRRYGVYGHDWRAMPPAGWLTLLGDREVGVDRQSLEGKLAAGPMIVLSQPDFAAAVREALRDFVRPDLLRNNPLLRSRLVLEAAGRGGDGEAADPVAVLQALLRQAAEALQASPRAVKLYRALYHTYFQPAPTQERAAELLDLPFSTYRRHLMAGVAQVTEALWAREVGS
jgi:hypothetical protein